MTLALIAVDALAILTPGVGAAPAPAWQVGITSHPTHFIPGSSSPASGGVYPEYAVIAQNVGAKSTSGPIVVTVQLPAGITPAANRDPSGSDQSHDTVATNETTCSVASQTVTCTDIGKVDPGEWVKMEVPVDVANLPDPSQRNVLATISGGGGAAATTQVATTVSAQIAPFGFLPGREGFNASVVNEDGSAATQAGSHPYQMNINLGFPTQKASGPDGFPIPDGSLKDAKVDLPAGLVGDPTATETCSQAEFTTFSCPEATEIGVAEIPLASSAIGIETSSVYNLDPPAGKPAAFGIYVTFVPVYILPEVHPGDYRISSLTPDAISLLAVFNALVQLWGSPTDKAHDKIRGECRPGDAGEDSCSVPASKTPLLSLPTSCTDSMDIDAHISLWEELGKFRDRSTVLTDANGNTTPLTGCEQLRFEPTLRARPTTQLADSPSGLEARLAIPQDNDVKTLVTSHLRKAVVTLPAGMAVNPASANGLAACSSSQVGIDPSTGLANGDPVACPNASRIGKVEVTTPLLDHPLPGSVFVATPHDNPFDSLLAIYVVVEDPSTGVRAKLAGHVVADPVTGQLTTTFEETPQLPFSEFKLDFFGGSGAALRTPATCGDYATTSSLTPWSAPGSGGPVTPSDPWSITQTPRGGACPTSDAALPNSPAFAAGSLSPIAGAHTPFVLNLSREDGTQQFSSVTLSPPPGLLAKLAGTAECPEAALAAAASKSGNAEKAAPSCPASSRIGSVDVSAGAGPAPYHTQGTAYLTGPYKGAPVGMAIITPATAGPYDLGTVVVRTALYVDPVTTKITAISDPIPTILQGIPLDVRSAQVSLDRPDFTLNGTSCAPSAVQGQLLSSQNQVAALFSRFQLGECSHLGFKPRLGLRLKGKTTRGGFPALRSTYTPRAGDANLEDLVLRLPRSEFIEQGHFGTVCTRVQFAAGAGHGAQCPAKSVYGQISATTPLLDTPLAGPVFLRSSNHNLPDVVFALHGRIEAEVAVRLDSVNGGLRASVEDAPDVPIAKVSLSMQGGLKGLFVNSRDLCAHTYRASVEFTGQNGKTHEAKPALRPNCGKGKGKGRRR
jgi:hypothetical protein